MSHQLSRAAATAGDEFGEPAAQASLADPGAGAVGATTPSTSESAGFTGLLYAPGAVSEPGAAPPDRAFVTDLNLDQVANEMSRDFEERELITAVFYRQLRDPDTIRFRQEIFRDLEDSGLFGGITEGRELLRRVRVHLEQLPKIRSVQHREAWFLDAAGIYCEGIETLTKGLQAAPISSQGLRGLRRFLQAYTASPEFRSLAADAEAQRQRLSQISYCVRIQGSRVEVSRYDGEPDYSQQVLETFDRFKQGAVKEYLSQYRGWPVMNHVGARILELVARLFPAEFSQLGDFCQNHADFFTPPVRQFEREIQFYLSYLAYIAPIRGAGLRFAFPVVSTEKDVQAAETFDLALAHKLVVEPAPVVTNSFELSGPERIFVVSGPNQGGKTTFARTFGQLHHLASIGYPVPGSSARLFLFDRIFTHFEREEDLAAMSGKLEDDLIRVRDALLAATPDSILILNEIFSSTALEDARFLGQKVLEKAIQLDLIGVYVTFIDELASMAPATVSMVSTIVPGDPSQRTFKVVRGPANGLAYALAIAEKHNLTYQQLRDRIRP